MVGGATLVQWRCRDDGNLLGRVQWTSDCGAPPSGTQGDRNHLFDRRSVRRRCTLHGRHASYGRGLEWASFFFGSMCLPPDPILVGDSWRAMWLERLENVPLFFEPWLQHQRRDAYWKHGSVCEDYEAIQCPVYAVGGWTDAYKNAIPRLLEGLTVPRKGLIGPWAHGYPHFALPGPQIGFLQEMLRWWDYWLKGIDTGVMDEPMLRAWMTESVKPASHHDALPGRWVAEPSWPSPGITPRRLFLTDEGLRDASGTFDGSRTCARRRPSANVQATGFHSVVGAIRQATSKKTTCARWFSRRRHSTRRSRSSARRSSRSMSRPTGRLRTWRFGYAMCTRPVNRCVSAMAYSTSLIATDTKQPALLAIGERYRVRIQLNDAGSVFPAGHRVRLALSTAYWPMIWPSPEKATLLISGGTLDLPVRPPRAADALLSPLPGPGSAPPEKPTIIRHGDVRIERIDRIGLELGTESKSRFHVEEDDPLSAVAENCDGPRRCRGTHGKSASRRRCGSHARAMPSCCREVCAPGKARTKSVVANGIALFLETSCENVRARQ